MRVVRLIYFALSTIPLLLLIGAHFAPPGSDSRGYGPQLVWLLISAAVGFVLLVVGVALCLFERRAHRPIRFVAAATFVSGIPFFLVLPALFGA